MGIIAACVPTLRHGWKWLTGKVASRSSRSGHTQITDEVPLRPYDKAAPMSTATATSTNGKGTLDEDNVLALPPVSHIQKTTRVDVDLEQGV